MKRKKYKVLKDFPGNAEPVGDFVIYHPGTFPEYFGNNSGKRYCAKDVENYPEYFEEVIDWDFEILEFTDTKGIKHSFDETFDMNLFNAYLYEGKIPTKIKRLSDNVEFSVGDKVKCTDLNKVFTIEKFETCFNTILAQNKNMSSPIKLIEHYKEPLFVTEDNVELFEGDEY